MTRDDIIRMAREVWGDDSGKPWHESAVTHLEAFAALVAAAEREACAKVADNGLFLHDDSPEARFGKACAAAIRARGKG